MESRKMVWWTFLQGSSGDTDIENRLTDMEWERKERWMNGESGMETYTTICKIDSQWEFAVWNRELKLGVCNNLEGWQGVGGGRGVQEGGAYVYLRQINVDAWKKPMQYCKAIILQLNINFKKWSGFVSLEYSLCWPLRLPLKHMPIQSSFSLGCCTPCLKL